MPTSAAGSRPTGDSTLNRPPTSGGTRSVAMPSVVASSRSAPCSGSVVNTRWRYAACPSASSSQRADHEVLRHRLRGSTRLADHVDEHPSRIDATKRGSDRRGIDVLEDGESGKEFAPFVVPLVPGRTAERVEQRLGAERGAPDAEHEDMIVRLTQPLGEDLDLAHRLVLSHESVKAVLACCPPTANLRLHRAEPGVQLAQAGAGQSVGPIETVLEHPPVGESDHCTSTVRPS